MKFGILICSYNGADNLDKTLSALASLMEKREFEVILVDNGSVDDTLSMFKKCLLLGDKDRVRILHECAPGKTNALLAGLRLSTADYVAIVDDDNWVSCEWFDQSTQRLSERHPVGVLGVATTHPRKDVMVSVDPHVLKMLALGRQGDTSKTLQDVAHCWGAGSWINVPEFHRLLTLGWRPVLSGRSGSSLIAGEDTEFCYAICLLGLPIIVDNGITIEHCIRSSRFNINYLAKLAYALGCSQPILYQYSHPDKNLHLLLFKDICIYCKRGIMHLLGAIKSMTGRDGSKNKVNYLIWKQAKGRIYAQLRLRRTISLASEAAGHLRGVTCRNVI